MSRSVYLSFGSQIYHQPGLFRRVIEATGGLGVQLVIAAQQLYDSQDLGSVARTRSDVRLRASIVLAASSERFCDSWRGKFRDGGHPLRRAFTGFASLQ